MSGEVASPLTMAVRKAAFTYAASSTPGGTRWVSCSSRKADSSAGGFLSSSTSMPVSLASSGGGTIFSLARSAVSSRTALVKSDTLRRVTDVAAPRSVRPRARAALRERRAVSEAGGACTILPRPRRQCGFLRVGRALLRAAAGCTRRRRSRLPRPRRQRLRLETLRAPLARAPPPPRHR
ncbi:hypothetical protein T492DRAFT_959367 [Pavlovales sp. CCMP2436]|nr:hypothetical protein T492DRAFT_959367 [Pavlovales sp. CCMP2436]